MIHRAVFCVVAMALLVGVAGQAVAGEDTESRLRALEQQLRAQEQEITQLRGALAEQQAESESIDSEIDQYFSKAGGEADLQAGWANMLHFTSADKAFSLKVGGKIILDYNFTDPNSKWKNIHSMADSYTQMFGFRFARMYMAGDIYKNTFFHIEFDLADDRPGDPIEDSQDIYIGIKNLPVIGHLRFGNQKEPFSLQALSPYRFISFMERAMAVNAFAPGRNVGIMAYDTTLDGALWWGIGIFNMGDGLTPAKTGNNIPARVAWAPIMDEESVLSVGISYAFHDDGSYSISVFPENSTAGSFYTNGSPSTFTAKANHLFGIEVAGRFGPFHFAGEWIWSMYDKASTGGKRDDVTLSGGYIQGGWFITGEPRGFENSVWARTSPNENFFDGNGGMGAFEVAARFSWLDLKDGIIQGDQAYDFTLGFNWYWNPNTRFMFNYVYSKHDEVAGSSSTSGGSINQFLFRLQIDW